MAGLDDLVKAKWWETGKQPILKADHQDVELAILQVAGRRSNPGLVWVSASSVRVLANADSPARCLMAGFPDVLHPSDRPVDAGLTDGGQRINTANTTMDFATASNLWGTEKAYQWYALMAIAADVDTEFTLKAMPWLRVSSQVTQTITLGGYNTTAKTGVTPIGYGFATDELVGYKIYFVSGGNKGIIRTVSANNNNNTTGGTITYSGAALSVTAGDWFILLPSDVNFRWIGDIYNDASSNIVKFFQSGGRVDLDVGLPYTCPGNESAHTLTTIDGAVLYPPMARWAGIVPTSPNTINPNTTVNPWLALQPVPIIDNAVITNQSWSGGAEYYYLTGFYYQYPSGMM
jgi:hypothetical protein